MLRHRDDALVGGVWTRPPRRVAVLAVVVVVGFAAFVVRDQLFGSGQEVSVWDAIARAGDLGDPVEGLPLPGVYVLDSEGTDAIDALGGVTHVLPAHSPLTVRIEGCGYVSRWDGLDERWEERQVCLGDDGWELRWYASSHVFFGTGDARTWTCEPGLLLAPTEPVVGDTSTTTCSAPANANNDAQTVRQVTEVLGVEDVVVDGAPVSTVHVRTRSEHVSGGTTGGGTTQRWVAPATGLVLREIKDSETVSPSAVGPVTHIEHAELQVTTLRPTR